ncbi:hypothetical protein [Treponema zioleckii]|uniref:hypothetical protein n=1 Tax=Treponema zioleckii TaxID=331680 RepID=UPI00168A69CD|nr:hypothetical protein [Treponema zioleckii]
MKKTFLLLLITIFCFPLVALEIWSPEVAANLKPESIKKDEKIIRSAIKFIKKNDFSDSKIRGYLEKNGSKIQPQNRGFGLQKYSGVFSDGYVRFAFDYISYENEPCKLTFYIKDVDWKLVENHLDKKVVKDFLRVFRKKETNYSFEPVFIYSAEFEFPDNYARFSEHKRALVGSLHELSIPKEYQKYYDFLFSAETESAYGYSGGVAPQKTDGRCAMEKLLELKDKRVFINILKGDNPCGRIYAAEGLLRLENSTENVKIINDIFAPLISEGITYKTIDGCIIFELKYPFYEYDAKLAFPEIKQFIPPVYNEDWKELEFELDWDKIE